MYLQFSLQANECRWRIPSLKISSARNGRRVGLLESLRSNTDSTWNGPGLSNRARPFSLFFQPNRAYPHREHLQKINLLLLPQVLNSPGAFLTTPASPRQMLTPRQRLVIVRAREQPLHDEESGEGGEDRAVNNPVLDLDRKDQCAGASGSQQEGCEALD